MGGAILAAQLSIVTAYGLVKNNDAIGHGGGIASIGKALLMLGQGSIFLGNNAGGSGGCIYAAGASVTFGKRRD
jgi:predicted outer membrane repeat protein